MPGVVLLTEPGTRNPDGDGVRLLIGFPDANSGAVAYFNATQVQLGGWAVPCAGLEDMPPPYSTWLRQRPPAPAFCRPLSWQGPSRDLMVELDNSTLTSVAVDGSVGLTVRGADGEVVRMHAHAYEYTQVYCLPASIA